MTTFRELQKACKLTVEGTPVKLAVLGNVATQFLSAAIEGSGKLRGINLQLLDADYDQIDAQLIDPSSEVCAFSPDAVLLYLASDRLYEDYLDLPFEEKASFADAVAERVTRYVDLAVRNTKARVLLMNVTEIDDKGLGQYSARAVQSFIYQIRKLNAALQEMMTHHAQVFPVDLAAVQNTLGREAFYDARLYYSSKMPIALNALPAVARAVTDVLVAMQGRIKKCVVLDLDNTLWGGVIGDDGMNGIEIGELGKGHVYTNLQRWLKELKDYGIILAVCSKNDEAVAKEPFEKHEDMVLRLSDIAVFVANWEDKATNIKLIQQTLNIGMDSIVFLDDNAFERNLVRERCLGITVPELPEDPAEWLAFLQRENYFETASFTGVSEDRTAQYQAEFRRRQSEASYDSIDDYLESLEMVAHAAAFDAEHAARIAQLTQRSNQFNLRTVRYTEEEVARLLEDADVVTRYYTLRDKFGDHGLIALAILRRTDDDTMFVDTWLMSCRVLKRTMEAFVVNDLTLLARSAGCRNLCGEYQPTAKNKMVSEIYDTFGFTLTEETADGAKRYTLALTDDAPRKTFVQKG